jgi:nitrogen fixation protein FixH
MKTLIVIVSIIGLAAVGGSIVVGVKSFDGIVTEHPYEKGLLWDEIRNKEMELGWQIDIQNMEFVTGNNDVLISVLDKYGRHLAGPGVTFMISRPATPAYDKYFDTIKVKEGMFKARINLPLYGYWDIDIDVSSGGDKLLFKKRIFVDKGGKKL